LTSTIINKMLSAITTVLGFAAAISAAPHARHGMQHQQRAAANVLPRGQDVSITPHDKYSSSIGVVGCHINVQRVAYFPFPPKCGQMCVKVTHEGRSLTLLHIDQSGGAFDISYDAWNILYTGVTAVDNPQMGGGIPATYEYVDMSECHPHIWTDNKKLPLQAANSMNFFTTCQNDSVLYNLGNCACTVGFDEVCTPPDLANGYNQAICPSGLGYPNTRTPSVYDIGYGTGKGVPIVQ